MRGIDAGQRELIRDVVNEGLSPYSPSALEKDLHLSFILERLAASQSQHEGLVLCGGTSLVKGHKIVSRMSEDMDFKVVVYPDVSKNQRSLLLSGLKKEISSLLAEDGFSVLDVSAHGRNSYFRIKLEYSASFPIEAALRPHILLEFTAETPFLSPVLCDSSSLLGLAISEEPRPVSFPCLDVEETVAEKSVAFLRRSRSSDFQSEDARDKRLVRHVYDIGSIGAGGRADSPLGAAFVNAIRRDSSRFATQDPEFAENPRLELARAFDNLKPPVLQADYEAFVESLVAGPALGFDQAFGNFRAVVEELLR